MAKKIKSISKVIKNKILSGVVYIKTTFNNTIVTVTQENGKVISWSSSGSCGFKGSRKSTPFASQTSTLSALKKAMDFGLGRETSIRTIQSLGLSILVIRDVTPIPHNGCRPQKKRRI
jgi:small subunit ribosomal protein S11